MMKSAESRRQPHERLTFRCGGRDYRLTDVHGHVVNTILAS